MIQANILVCISLCTLASHETMWLSHTGRFNIPGAQNEVRKGSVVKIITSKTLIMCSTQHEWLER